MEKQFGSSLFVAALLILGALGVPSLEVFIAGASRTGATSVVSCGSSRVFSARTSSDSLAKSMRVARMQVESSTDYQIFDGRCRAIIDVESNPVRAEAIELVHWEEGNSISESEGASSSEGTMAFEFVCKCEYVSEPCSSVSRIHVEAAGKIDYDNSEYPFAEARAGFALAVPEALRGPSHECSSSGGTPFTLAVVPTVSNPTGAAVADKTEEPMIAFSFDGDALFCKRSCDAPSSATPPVLARIAQDLSPVSIDLDEAAVDLAGLQPRLPGEEVP